MSPDFDLDCLDELQTNQEAGILVPVLKPGTQDILFSVRVVGPDSAQQDRARERAAEEMSARGAQTPLTREESREAAALYLARCCMEWDAKDKSGAPIPFNEANVAAAILRYPIVRDTIDAAASSRTRFMMRSSTASAAASTTA